MSEITSSNPVVKSVIEGSAPRPACLAASRGALPLAQADLLEVLVHFAQGDDPELKDNAVVAIGSQSEDSIRETVDSPEVAPSVLSYFAGRPELPAAVHEAVIQNKRTPPQSIARLARATQNGALLELISLNQQLLIQNPPIIDAIIGNAARTAEAERRASETKREFFEKERGAQQIANELRARGQDAAAEFIEQAEFASDLDGSGMTLDDAAFIATLIEVPDQETDDSWLSLEYIEEIYEETEEQRQAAVNSILGQFKMEGDDLTSERVSMINRIMKMGVKDRVKLGMKGDREARNILIRDPNRLVCNSVVNNPRITEQEVEMIAAMRAIPEDVLRGIATNRQWSRLYNISHALARNPRTPIANVMTILTRLQLRDLVALSKNRNVSDAVRRQALRLSSSRTGGRTT